jgi:hypothetical protein
LSEIPGFKFGGWKGFFGEYKRLLEGRKGVSPSRPLSGFLGVGRHSVRITEVRTKADRVTVVFSDGLSTHVQTYFPTSFSGQINWPFFYLTKAVELDSGTVELFLKAGDLSLFTKGLAGKEVKIELGYRPRTYLLRGNGLGSWKVTDVEGKDLSETWFESLGTAEGFAEDKLKLKKARLEVLKISN